MIRTYPNEGPRKSGEEKASTLCFSVSARSILCWLPSSSCELIDLDNPNWVGKPRVVTERPIRYRRGRRLVSDKQYHVRHRVRRIDSRQDQQGSYVLIQYLIVCIGVKTHRISLAA